MSDGHCFISYSSRDAEIALRLCEVLEEQGVVCWIAPRDVEAGAYGASIVRGIRAARVLVFVATTHSAVSSHVGRELERAVNAGIPIVPLRMDETEFSEELEYYLAGMHWLEPAGRSLEAFAPEVAGQVKSLVSGRASDGGTARVDVRKRRGAERLLDALLSLPPTIFALGLSLIGALLVLLSAGLGIAEFRYILRVGDMTVAKEVGFFWAFNWSLSLVIVYPAVAGIGLQALREIDALPAKLVARRMVVDRSFQPAQRGAVEAEVRRALASGVKAALVLLVLFSAYAAWEFSVVIGNHYYSGDPFPDGVRIDDPFLERDWSIAALLPAASGTSPAHWPNYGFAFAAYVFLVGLGTSLVFGVFIFFLSIATAIYRMSGRAEGLRLIPDIRDPRGRRGFDPRCGFEIFVPLFRHARAILLLSFVTLFLVNLQNTYIRSASPHILEYALPSTSFANGVLAEFTDGSTLRSTISNLNGALSYGVAGLLFASIVFGLSLTLRLGAQQAHGRLLRRVEDEDTPLPPWLQDQDRAGTLERLDGMTFQIAGWMRAGPIMACFALAIVSLVFPKIGVVLAGLSFFLVAASALGGAPRSP